MRARWLFCVVLICSVALFAFGGGPILVGGPGFGLDAKPLRWNPAKMPISYRVDPGPMAMKGSTTVISNATGLQRLQNMFAVWQTVPTAAVSFSNAGPLLPAGSYTGGDLTTVQQYNDVMGSCKSGVQSPVIFDADGSILSGLGLPPEIIGFASGCALDKVGGYLTGASILLNGKMQDGVSLRSVPLNYELTANEFDEAITHEMGHFLGLDHSQINLDVMTSYKYPCDVDSLAGLPLMFPVALCQARKDAGLPVLAPDDVSWISTLYPSASYASTYATISGRIFFSDGISQFQGANVIARLVDDHNTTQDESRRVAVSVVSGYLFTGNPGQSVTASMADPNEDNAGGDLNGSRSPQLIGYYEIAVPPGTYTVEVESLDPDFVSDSGLGPLYEPVAVPIAEFWKTSDSAFDLPLQRDNIPVHAGDKITGTDIILNGTRPRFDSLEDDGALFDVSPPAPLRTATEVRA